MTTNHQNLFFILASSYLY